MIAVFEQVLILVIFVGLGFALSRFKVVDSAHAKLLSSLEVYLFLPATVFNTFSTKFTVKYITDKYYFILVSAVILAVMFVVCHFVSKLLSKDPFQHVIYSYSLMVSNFSYMGYALAGSLYGSDTMLNVMIFSLPLLFYTYSFGYCSLTKQKVNLRSILSPLVISMFIGAVVGVTGLKMPELITGVLDKAAACMAPVSMLIAGMVISEFKIKELLVVKKNYAVAIVRLLVIPITIAFILKLLGLDEMIIPSLMVNAMSCGLNTMVFPRLIGEDCKTGASLAVISNLLVCATVPLCVYLFS